jgi:hypothetical protein
MNQGTQGYRFTKKTKGLKSRETVPLKAACKALFKKLFMMFYYYLFIIINFLGLAG